jgi:hypothetical protein
MVDTDGAILIADFLTGLQAGKVDGASGISMGKISELLAKMSKDFPKGTAVAEADRFHGIRHSC